MDIYILYVHLICNLYLFFYMMTSILLQLLILTVNVPSYSWLNVSFKTLLHCCCYSKCLMS